MLLGLRLTAVGTALMIAVPLESMPRTTEAVTAKSDAGELTIERGVLGGLRPLRLIPPSLPAGKRETLRAARRATDIQHQDETPLSENCCSSSLLWRGGWRGADAGSNGLLRWFHDQNEPFDAAYGDCGSWGERCWPRRLACQSSPRISTCPVGESGVRTMAVPPIMACGPVRTLLRRARRAIQASPKEIAPKPRPRADGGRGVNPHLRDGAVD